MKPANKILTDANLNNSYWGKRIISAEKRGYFIKNDRDASRVWVTCACGKLEGIERDIEGVPVDDKLRKLGLTFSVLIYDDNFVTAAITLVDIEKRALELQSERGKS